MQAKIKNIFVDGAKKRDHNMLMVTVKESGMNLGELLMRKINNALAVKPRYDMRISEEKLRVFTNRMMRQGWTYLSTRDGGYYAIHVMLSPCGSKVAKITDNGDFYNEFAKHCCIVRDKHLPKIYTARSICRGAYFITIMERLSHLPNMDAMHNDEIFPDNLEFLSCIKYAQVDIDGLVARKMGSIVRCITGLFADLGRFNDCHYGNMMLREDGTVVFTDPYCGEPWSRRQARRRANGSISDRW